MSEIGLPYSAKALRDALKRDAALARKQVASVTFDLEAFCGAHVEQAALTKDRSPRIHLMCARQSGKTYAADAIMLANALAVPRSTNLLLHLNGVAVRRANWFPIWRQLCDKAGVPEAWHNETSMTTTMPNGARVMFAGTDDLTHVKGFLGNKLNGGVVVVDESQDQADSTLDYLLDVLLPPMLDMQTRIILAGVLPDVEAGRFLELADAPGWSHHGWGRAANVHTPESAQVLEGLLATGKTVDDPQIARDWFLRRVWLKDATAYGYDRDRNGYHPTRAAWEEDLRRELEAAGVPIQCLMAAVPMAGVDTFSVGIDPGGEDRFPVEVWGWGPGCKFVQHVFDFCPPRGAKLSWGKLAATVLHAIEKHLRPSWRVYDAGSSTNELEVFTRDTGLVAIAAAKKSDTRGQIRRVLNLFAEGRAKVMIGSALEDDFRKARRDPDSPPAGPWKWSAQWHPDPSEAARYALAPYFDAYQAPPPDPPSESVALAQVHQGERDRLLRMAARPLDDLGRFVERRSW